MIDIIPNLNNFSVGLEEIIQSYENSSKLTELPFMDLDSIMIPPPPDDEDNESIFSVKKKKRKEDIGTKILELQNSVVEKLILNNSILEDQKESLRIMRNQNPTIVTEYQTNTNSFFDRDFLENIKLSTKNEQVNPNVIPQTKFNQESDQPTILQNVQSIITEFISGPSIRNSLNMEEIPEILVDDIEIKFRIPDFKSFLNKFTKNPIQIPVEIKDSNLKLDSKSIVDVFYSIKNKVPKIGDLIIDVPKIVLPKIESISVPLTFEDTLDQIDFGKLTRTIDYVEKRKVLEDKISRIGYEYEDLLKQELPPSEDIKIKTEYSDNYSERSIEKNLDVFLTYQNKNNFDSPKQDKLSIPVGYKFDKMKIVEPINVSKQIREIYLNYQYNNQLEKLKSENQSILVDMIPRSRFEIKDLQNEYLTKNTTFNENIETFEIKDGFTETISNISNFLDDFIGRLEDLENYKFSNPYDEINLKIIKNDESSKDLISNVDLGKINTINKSSVPSVLLSTLEPKQFNSLIETLEKNSKINSDDYKFSNSTEKVTTNPMFNLSLPKEVDKASKSEEKLIEIMSRLDDKMSIMISALSNISTWVNENRSSSTSLKPYKH